MDPDLIDPNLIFAKTPSGEEAMLQRTRVVQRNIRMVLILVDGNATVAELCDKTGNAPITQNALLELEGDGFIERRVERNSVWRHGRNSPKRHRGMAGANPPSEFSTFGDRRDSPRGGSPMSGSHATRIIPFPDSRESRVSTASTPLAPRARDSNPHSGTVFMPKSESAAEPSSVSTSASPQGAALLLDRLRSLVTRGAAGRPYIKPRRRGGGRLSISWPLGLMLGLLLIAVVVVLIALFFPYAHYLPAVEARLAQTTGQATRVGEMRFSLYPKPVLLLDTVRLGKEADPDHLQIAAIRLQPTLGSLLSSRILFREAELSGLTLTAETVRSLSRMLESAAREPATAELQNISVSNAEISFAGLGIGEMKGEIKSDFELPAGQALQSLSLQSSDRSLQVQLKPTTSGVAVRLEGLGWRPAQGSPYRFDSLSLEGEIDGSDFVINTLELRIFDGLVRGATVLQSRRLPSMAGEIAFERINFKKFGEALGIGSQFEGDATGKLKFSATSETWSAMISAVQATGDFMVHRGSLGGIDLPEAVRRASPVPVTVGGRTRFEDLSGAITLTPTVSRFSRLVLSAGLMQATGRLEVSRDLKLLGRMDVLMRGRPDHAAMPILISGTLKSPLVHTAGAGH